MVRFAPSRAVDGRVVRRDWNLTSLNGKDTERRSQRSKGNRNSTDHHWCWCRTGGLTDVSIFSKASMAFPTQQGEARAAGGHGMALEDTAWITMGKFENAASAETTCTMGRNHNILAQTPSFLAQTDHAQKRKVKVKAGRSWVDPSRRQSLGLHALPSFTAQFPGRLVAACCQSS
jgi:hypothetical protein